MIAIILITAIMGISALAICFKAGEIEGIAHYGYSESLQNVHQVPPHK